MKKMPKTKGYVKEGALKEEHGTTRPGVQIHTGQTNDEFVKMLICHTCKTHRAPGCQVKKITRGMTTCLGCVGDDINTITYHVKCSTGKKATVSVKRAWEDERVDQPVDTEGMSSRTANVVSSFFKTWWDIAEKSEGDLLRIKNFGKKSLKELKEILESRGLPLPRPGRATMYPEWNYGDSRWLTEQEYREKHRKGFIPAQDPLPPEYQGKEADEIPSEILSTQTALSRERGPT